MLIVQKRFEIFRKKKMKLASSELLRFLRSLVDILSWFMGAATLRITTLSKTSLGIVE